MTFETKRLPTSPDVRAPDGSDVRALLALEGGSMAHFELPSGLISQAVAHKTVSEVWYMVGGQGEMWRRLDDQEEVVDLAPGICISIPAGTAFQFRTTGPDPISAIAVTMPPWPGETEAYEVTGKWVAKLSE